MKRLGIVELNSTEVKLLIVEVLENQSYVTLLKEESKIKIASDLVADELIKQQSIFNVISVLKTYKSLMSAYKVVECFALATNEYANAKNQRSFFEEIYSSTNFKFKIMSQDEEISNLYVAFINSLDCPKGLILNINGTESQVFAYNRRNSLNRAYFNVGSVSYAEKYVEKYSTPAEAMDVMTKDFATEVASLDWFKELDEETQIVGTGDVFLSIAKLSKKLKKYPFARDHSYQFTKEDLDQVYDFVKTLDIDKTKKLKGISSQSADMLASGVSMVKAFAEKSGFSKFVVSTYGISEGNILGKVNPITLEKPISDVLGASLETQNLYYNNSGLQNTANVYELSLILFKQLKVLHKLPRNFVKVLRIASYLHDCGKRVSPINFEKKGLNVVLDCDVLGVAHHEQVLAAFVVASQNLQDFSMVDWVRYNSMVSETDLEGVRKLAVIVKLATMLDSFGLGKIKDISCDILGDSVIMKTIVEEPADMEISESMKVRSDFAKAFKKHLEIL
ncbi:MAG TPA: hypothetical protein DCO89_00765 [Clostridiales bacterium]|nr:hypothetical protein [Clostridiales bacterium]